MHFPSAPLAAAALVSTQHVLASVPSLAVPACPDQGTIQYSRSVPNNTAFPPTEVALCYTSTSLHIDFTARHETNFFFNPNYTLNDPIYEYEVMEAFVARGTHDPTTYLELEVAPNNVTFTAFIFNPSRVRAPGAAFDTFFVPAPRADGLRAATALDRAAHTWRSHVAVPLALFNVGPGGAEPRGSRWRMNFFRTVVKPSTFPAQLLGAWSPVPEPNFHETPYFGHVTFV